MAMQAGPSWERSAPASGSASVLVVSAATGAARGHGVSIWVLIDDVRLAAKSIKTAFSLAILSALALSLAANSASSFVSRVMSNGESAFGLDGSTCRVRSTTALSAAVLLRSRS